MLPDYAYIPEDLTIRECFNLFGQVYDTFNIEKAIQIFSYLNLNQDQLISSYSKGMKEKEREWDETDLLAGPEGGLLLDLAQ